MTEALHLAGSVLFVLVGLAAGDWYVQRGRRSRATRLNLKTGAANQRRRP